MLQTGQQILGQQNYVMQETVIPYNQSLALKIVQSRHTPHEPCIFYYSAHSI
jgi:hypothetical protein